MALSEHHLIPANLAPPREIPEERIDLFLHEPLPLEPVDSAAFTLLAINTIFDGDHFIELSCQGATRARFEHLSLFKIRCNPLATITAFSDSKL
jgi:hypothetical protein